MVTTQGVSAAKDRNPFYRKTKKKFECAAAMANQNETFKGHPIAWKAMQNSHKRLQEQNGEQEDLNWRLSGVGGGEMGKVPYLMMRVREAKDDYDSQKSALRIAK